MSNLATLSPPFKKGYDPRRNTTGKNKGSVSITRLVREGLKEIGKGETEAYEILLRRKILAKAVKEGNEKMIQLVWAYMDGQPKNTGLSDEVKSVVGLLLGIHKHESATDDAETE